MGKKSRTPQTPSSTTRTTSTTRTSATAEERTVENAGTVEQDEKDPVKVAQEALKQKKKKRGRVGGVFQKVGEKVGIVEQTKIAPEFQTEMEKYIKYQNYADKMVDYLEKVLQQNPNVLKTQKIECEPKKDPIEYFFKAIKRLKFKFVSEKDAQYKKISGVEGVCRRLAVMERESQIAGRRCIRKLRVFVATEYEYFIEEQQKLASARDIMDSARHDLKSTRTTEEVEAKGRIYEQSVYEFNEIAEGLDTMVAKIPNSKLIHEKQICDFIEVRGMHHQKTASMLSKALANLGVEGYTK